MADDRYILEYIKALKIHAETIEGELTAMHVMIRALEQSYYGRISVPVEQPQ